MSFVNLHNHTHYSILNGFATCADYVNWTEQNDATAFAITDNSSIYGAVEFAKAMKKANKKPIIGTELYLAARTMGDKEVSLDKKTTTIVVLVKNKVGYKNLCQIITAANLHGFYYKPRVDDELLTKHADGLIMLSGGILGSIGQALLNDNEELACALTEKYHRIFGPENFYLEMIYRPEDPDYELVNTKIHKLSHKTHTPIIATANSFYADRTDAQAHDVVICLANANRHSDTGRFSLLAQDLSPRTEQEMLNAFPKCPEAISNTQKIADKINFTFEFGKYYLPAFDLPSDFQSKKYAVPTPDEAYLRYLCYRELAVKYDIKFTAAQIDIGVNKLKVNMTKKIQACSLVELKKFVAQTISPEKEQLFTTLTKEQQIVMQRLEYELFVIHKMGYDTYFLVVRDYIVWAKNNNIAVGPGRGSGAGAIVAYLAQITNIEPLRYGLLFERFLNPARVSMPDFDIDFADDKRDLVFNYVRQKYGEERVAHIGTFGTMAARAALKDVGRVYDIPFAEMNILAQKIPFGSSLAEAYETVELKKELENPVYQKIFDLAKKMEGHVRQTGVHACGLVIAPTPLINFTALQHPPKSDDNIVTQYEWHAIEDMGLLKMDFLGLKNLSVISKCVKIVANDTQEKIDIDNIPLDDKPSYKLITDGHTVGVFQLESDGITRYIKELKPSNINDIIAMISLYRPGPIGFIPDYIKGKHGQRKITYPHPSLKEILTETYGIIVYQEQVIKMAQIFAGFSLGEADLLRRAIGKKIKSELQAQRENFIHGALKIGNLKQDAIHIFDDVIMPFAQYGFNKSHSTGYALISYQTAYLKANYTTEFMTALMIADSSDTDRIIIDIEEAKKLKIEVLAPSVNESRANFTFIAKNKIRFGLNAIKGLGDKSAQAIITARGNEKFTTFEEFIARTPHKVLNKKSLEALSHAGALDDLIDSNQIIQNMDTIIRFINDINQTPTNTDQNGLFDDIKDLDIIKLELKPTTAISIIKKLQNEKEVLGLYVSAHPLDGLFNYFAQKLQLIAKLNSTKIRHQIKLAGLLSHIHKIITKSGKAMAYLHLEDPSGIIAAVLMPTSYEKYETIINEHQLFLISGTLEARNGKYQLLINDLTVKNLTDIIAKAKTEKLFDSKLKISQQNHKLKELPSNYQTPQRYHNKVNNLAKQKTIIPKTPQELTKPITENKNLTELKPIRITLPERLSTTQLKQLQTIITAHPGTQAIIFMINNQEKPTKFTAKLTETELATINKLLNNT